MWSVETVGVYSSPEEAKKHAEKIPFSKFNIEEMAVDAPPLDSVMDKIDGINDYDDLQSELDELDEISTDEIIESLMEDGILEQVIGEDGHFYYRVPKKS